MCAPIYTCSLPGDAGVVVSPPLQEQHTTAQQSTAGTPHIHHLFLRILLLLAHELEHAPLEVTQLFLWSGGGQWLRMLGDRRHRGVGGGRVICRPGQVDCR